MDNYLPLCRRQVLISIGYTTEPFWIYTIVTYLHFPIFKGNWKGIFIVDFLCLCRNFKQAVLYFITYGKEWLMNTGKPVFSQGIDDCLSSPYLTSIKIIARILWYNKDLPENFGLITQ